MNHQHRREQQIAIPTVSEMGAIVVSGITKFAKKNKVISTSYILGILFLLLIGSGTKLTADQSRRYNSIMNTIDLRAEFEASNRYADAMHAYRATKGWFSCDSLCQRNKKRMKNTERVLEDIRNEGYARMSDAKSVAGIFSEVGVEEVKDSFWHYFKSGKQFAKRQSMWDMMFMGIRKMSRDESMMEYAVKVLIQVLINFSMGLIGAFFVFVIGLWSIVRSYQPNPLAALAFLIGASCAAFAFISTYLFVIFGTAAGGIYGVAKVAEANTRIQADQRQQRQNMQNRPHWE